MSSTPTAGRMPLALEPSRAPDAVATGAQWQLAHGVTLTGEALGSGLREQTFHVERPDGTLVQVSALVYAVLLALAATTDPSRAAAQVSEESGRPLSEALLVHLLQARLEPLGLVHEVGRPVNQASEPAGSPLLALRLHATLIPARAVGVIARALAPLYWWPVVWAALGGLLTLDALLIRRGSAGAALNQVLTTPVFILVLLGLTSAAGLVHELGHAAASHYGGARPGAVGIGLYLVMPAFYTDVTRSQRLDRAGRIRTDLGGLYFNVWCLLAAGIAYARTGEGILLLFVVLLHIEMAQQLIPTVRFDGYYVLADIAGVPDLFARIRPILSTLRPSAGPQHPKAAELRPAARRVVLAWTLVTVPILVAGCTLLVVGLPALLERTVAAMGRQVHLLTAAWTSSAYAAAALAVVSIVLLALPLIGLPVVAIDAGRRLARAVIGRVRRAQSQRPRIQTTE